MKRKYILLLSILTFQDLKRAIIGYTLDDLKGISPSICQHTINLEPDAKPVVDHQRWLNRKMKDVVRTEVLKLLAAGIIYPIADSKWVSPVHCVPKKGGMTVVTNDKNELIPQRTIIGYRMCIDSRKLNKATRKDHYPLPFIDQMLQRLSKNTQFCYLDGFLASPRFMLTPRIRRRPLLRVLKVLMLIGVCLLVCVMHLLLFRGVCLQYFMVSVRRL